MKIDSGVVGMESARSYQSYQVTVKQFVIMDYQENKEEKEQEELKKESKNDTSAGGLEQWQNRFGISFRKLELNREDQSVAENLRQVTLRMIFDMLFASRRRHLSDWMEEHGYALQETDRSGETNAQQEQRVRVQTTSQQLFFRRETSYYEQENTGFAARGKVKTSDGREIDFKVNLAWSNSFEAHFSQELQAAKPLLCDPLVINLDVDSASVTDQRFYFDLDADGEEDEIANLGSGSGFLALDKNEDGKINDGSELFGTTGGDGFRDLAQYDEDGNGWIDENDEIWKKLKIWTKDAQGQDHLYTLAEKGVGAICLGNVGTDVTQRDGSGNVSAMVRKTGIFLYETGEVGTLQHLDMAKYKKEA